MWAVSDINGIIMNKYSREGCYQCLTSHEVRAVAIIDDWCWLPAIVTTCTCRAPT